jgi:hypothetical protein
LTIGPPTVVPVTWTLQSSTWPVAHTRGSGVDAVVPVVIVVEAVVAVVACVVA